MSESYQASTQRGTALDASGEACGVRILEASATNDAGSADFGRVIEHLSKKNGEAMLEGWEQYRLGEITSFKNGLNFTRAEVGEVIKIVGVSDFKNKAKLDSTDQLATIQVSAAVRDNELLKSGDLLFVRSNGNKALIGRCLYFPVVQERLAFSGFTIRGRVKTAVLDPLFASYLMRSQLVLDQIFLGGSGTNISNLSQEILANIVVQVPCLIEQQRIAQVLSTWDQAIEATERLLSNTERQKLGLMQKLLTGEVRLLAYTDVWKQYALGELFSERVDAGRDDLPLLSITREQGVIMRDEVGRKDTSNEDKSKYLRICRGDIGYNTMRMWQGVSALSNYEGIVSPAYTVIAPGKLIDGKFASFLFKSQPVVFLFYRHSQGLVSDTWNLKFPHFSKIKVHIPGVQEQREIAAILEQTDKQIATINAELVSLRKEKAALMAHLLTGKRRVKLSTVAMEELE